MATTALPMTLGVSLYCTGVYHAFCQPVHGIRDRVAVHGTPGERDFWTVDGSCCILYWEESISG